MVNFSSKTPEQKPLLYFPANSSKKIHKQQKSQKSPKCLKSLNFHEEEPYNTSSEGSFLSHPEEKTLEIGEFIKKDEKTSNLINILQPFCNYGLFPGALQSLVSGSEKLDILEIRQLIYQLKTPENPINFQKKIEKMKLLALGQETILQNYLKDKFMSSQKPELIKDYYKYMKSKFSLLKEIQDCKGRNIPTTLGHFRNENSNNNFGNFDDFIPFRGNHLNMNFNEENWMMKFGERNMAHNLLYDHIEHKHDGDFS